MNFNKFLKSLFGDKSTRDMKLIQPLVEKVKAVSTGQGHRAESPYCRTKGYHREYPHRRAC